MSTISSNVSLTSVFNTSGLTTTLHQHGVQVRAMRRMDDSVSSRNIREGVHTVNQTVTVVGEVRKGRDYKQVQVNRMNPTNVLAFVLGKMGKHARNRVLNEILGSNFKVTPSADGHAGLERLKGGLVADHSGKTSVNVSRIFG